MMLGKYNEALNDAREAVRLDKNFVKVRAFFFSSYFFFHVIHNNFTQKSEY